MTSLKFSGTKRKCSESPSQGAANVSLGSSTSASPQTGSSDSGASSGGGSSSGEVEDEEESSSSSSPVDSGFDSSRVKRFKHTLASIRENASEEFNTDLSEDSSKDPAKFKEYGRVNAHQLNEASRIAAAKGGECISKVTIGAGETLAFKCHFGHIFRCSVAAATSDWCVTCQRYYAQCVEFAARNNGKLLDSKLRTPVRFECAKGHVFTCKTYKAKHLRWCNLCKEQEEELKKQQSEQQKAQESATKVKEQEKLFEEARRLMEQETAARAFEEARRYEVYLEQMIRQKAKMESSVGKVGEADCYLVNKILMTPIELLVQKWYSRFFLSRAPKTN